MDRIKIMSVTLLLAMLVTACENKTDTQLETSNEAQQQPADTSRAISPTGTIIPGGSYTSPTDGQDKKPYNSSRSSENEAADEATPKD